jgi:hypothetical protein
MNKSVSETGEILQERIPINDSQMGQSEVIISTPKSSRALALLISTGSTEYVLVLPRLLSAFVEFNMVELSSSVTAAMVSHASITSADSPSNQGVSDDVAGQKQRPHPEKHARGWNSTGYS